MKSIDRETCNKIVENKLKHSRFQLMHFEENDEIAKKGLLSDYRRLFVTIRCDSVIEEMSFFLKYFPEDSSNKAMQNFITFHECFKKEMLTYQYFEEAEKSLKVAESKFMPRCYYRKYNEFLVLEDLRSSNFVNVPFDDVGILHCKLVLQHLAKFQATSIAYESKICSEPNSSVNKRFDFDIDSIYNSDKTTPFYAFLNSSKKCLISMKNTMDGNKHNMQKFEKKMEYYFDKIFEPLNTYRRVLSHGDLWLNNTLFRYEEGKPVDCKIIDFQTTSFNVPAFDVLYFIFSTTTKKSRKLYYHDLLNFYYDSLKEELNNFELDVNSILPLSEFLITCRLLLPQIKLLTVIQASVDLFGEDVSACTENLEKYRQFLLEDRSPLVLEILKKDEVYKASMIENLEMIEDGFMNTIVTIEDCYQMIHNKIKSNDYDVLHYELRPFAVKNGFLGEHFDFDIMIDYLGEKQYFSLFLKCLPNTPEIRELCIENGVFFKESKFFTKYIPFLKEHNINILDDIVPECALADCSVIVLENLAERGFKTFTSRDNLGLDVIKLALESIAKFHSSCLIAEDTINRSKNVEYSILQDFGEEFKEIFYRDSPSTDKHTESCKLGMNAIIDLAFNKNSESDRQLFKNFAHFAIDSQKEYIKPSSKYRNTICHSDVWTKNFMIQLKNGEATGCVILDFQTYRYCPPAQDVMLLIYLNTTKSLRNEHLYGLKEHYYNQLEKQLDNYSISIDDVMNREQFFECCDYYEQFAIMHALFHFQLCILPPDVIDELFADPIKAQKAHFDEKYDFMKDMWYRDVIFKTKQTELINELRRLYDKHRSEK